MEREAMQGEQGHQTDSQSPTIANDVDLVKLALKVTKENYHLVEELARARQQTRTNVINQAIATESFLRRQLRAHKGRKLFFKDPDGTMREVILG